MATRTFLLTFDGRSSYRAEPVPSGAVSAQSLRQRHEREVFIGLQLTLRRRRGPVPAATVDGRPPSATTVRRLKRIGHKGADSIRPGNTLESFEAAVAAGAEMIELDVLRPRAEFATAATGAGRPPGRRRRPGARCWSRHDWGDAARREPLTLDAVLDAFTRPPLDRVQIDCDLKIAGREDEVVAALRKRGTDRAGGDLDHGGLEPAGARASSSPDLPRGWTLPKVTRDWNSIPWAKPAGARGARLAAEAPAGDRRAVARRRWECGRSGPIEPVVTGRLARACHDAGLELIAWTVDDLAADAGARRGSAWTGSAPTILACSILAAASSTAGT